jgi:hypothetical protein
MGVLELRLVKGGVSRCHVPRISEEPTAADR